MPGTLPAVIGVRAARHHYLRDVDGDVPLWRTVAVAAVSRSGKTSLAMVAGEQQRRVLGCEEMAAGGAGAGGAGHGSGAFW